MFNYNAIKLDGITLDELLKEQDWIFGRKLPKDFNYRERLESLYGDKFYIYAAFLLVQRYRRKKFSRYIYQFSDVMDKISDLVLVGRICPYCGEYFQRQFVNHLSYEHGKSVKDYLMTIHNLSEWPKCDFCGSDRSISSHYYISNTCGSPSCEHKCAERTKVQNGNHNFAYNGNPDHDRELWYWHSTREYIKIGNGTHPLSYSDDSSHNLRVYQNHISGANRGNSGSFGYKSTVKYKDKFYPLKSKLELIFASYLSVKGYDWRYEMDHTDFGKNDFCVNNTMFEVKWDYTGVPEEQKISAISSGYKFRIITKDILYNKCCRYLVNKGFPIWKLIKQLTEDTTLLFDFDEYFKLTT